MEMAGYVPYAGDFNSDGCQDRFFFKPATGESITRLIGCDGALLSDTATSATVAQAMRDEPIITPVRLSPGADQLFVVWYWKPDRPGRNAVFSFERQEEAFVLTQSASPVSDAVLASVYDKPNLQIAAIPARDSASAAQGLQDLRIDFGTPPTPQFRISNGSDRPFSALTPP